MNQKKSPDCNLIGLLNSLQKATKLSLSDWDRIIPQARRSVLMAYLAHRLDVDKPGSGLPEKVCNHLFSEKLAADRQLTTLYWEIKKLQEVFELLELPIILLKGAAYIVLGLKASKGRFISDMDLLVAHQDLSKVECSLSVYGWKMAHQDDYDDTYYRKWMHEIPPLEHMKRRTVLDVHHTILPPTAKYKPDPAKIIANIRRTDIKNVYVLAPEDMVIHSATHLFHEGEFDHGLRDLLDIHELLAEFSMNEPGFWDRLAPRAVELDLLRPLYYGLHYAQTILSTAIPEATVQQVEVGAPNRLMGPIMDWFFMRALRPVHPDCDLFGTGLARWLLYIRSHYLRMPLRLLIPHLVRKAWKKRFKRKEEEQPSP